ncbi:MAG: endolytic transglycosylase MltG [Sulfurovaceae bacterium]|nr:endolytic transglycosylase MltG [Sulfurovaceae bacterium]
MKKNKKIKHSSKKYKPKKHKKYIKGLYIAISILLILVLAFLYYIYTPIETHKKTRIPAGSISHTISELNKQGYNVGFLDRYILYFMGEPKAGIIDFGNIKSISRIEFLRQIINLSPSHTPSQLTLIPGETLEIFFEETAAQTGLDKNILLEEYKKQSSYPEAGISADTYFISDDMNEKQLIEFLIKESEAKYTKLAIKYKGSYNKKEWQRILTIASIIQKEAANTKEMPLVSSVIYNRLAKNMKLQMDGTLNYGKYSHIKVTSERIKNDSSNFNTYKNYGLPGSPIGSVSLEAINAAINPAKTDYLYFVKNSSGTHTFSSDFEEHRKAIESGN